MHGGAFKPLLMNFLKEERLSAEDIQELKALLDDQNKTK
jgi:BlaI family penicillinase repressor